MTISKFNRKLPTSTLLVLTCSLSVFSCAKKPVQFSGGAQPGTAAAAENGVGGITGTIAGTGATAPSGDGKACVSPFSLEDPALIPITDKASLPKGKFNLTGIQTYVSHAGSGNSYSASAQESNGFEVKLDCASDLANAQPETLEIADSIDESHSIGKGSQMRKLEVKFENGQLSPTWAIPTTLTSGDRSLSPNTLGEPIQVSPGVTMTFRFYVLPSKQLEMRVKTDSLDEKDGTQKTVLSRALYNPAQ